FQISIEFGKRKIESIVRRIWNQKKSIFMSAKDTIEELFRDNQHGMDEQPRDFIWDKIEERLDEKSVQKKKLNVWKYAVAASVVFAVGIGLFALLNNQNQVTNLSTQKEITYEKPVEINQENASEILDQIEEKNQSVVINEKEKSAPEIIKLEENPTLKHQIPEPKMKPEPVYDVAPVASRAYEAPMTKQTEAEIYADEKAKVMEETIASQTEVSEKRANYFLSKKEDVRRMGNMAENPVVYQTDSVSTNQISIPLKKSTVQYHLVSKNDSISIYENTEIAYPSQIIFKQTNDSVLIIYSGKNSKRNSKESKEIQSYINQNKNVIFNSEIQID